MASPDVERMHNGERRVTIPPNLVRWKFGIGNDTTLRVYFGESERGHWVFRRMEEACGLGSARGTPALVTPPALWSEPMQVTLSYAASFVCGQEGFESPDGPASSPTDAIDPLPDDSAMLIEDDGGEDNLTIANNHGRRPAWRSPAHSLRASGGCCGTPGTSPRDSIIGRRERAPVAAC